MSKRVSSSSIQSSRLSQSVAALGIASTLAIVAVALFPASSVSAQTAPTQTESQTAQTDSARAAEAKRDSMIAHRSGPGGKMNERREGRLTDRMFDRIKATPEQREKILGIMKNSKGDMRAQHEARLANRKAMSEALAAATLDRTAIEKLRQAQLAQTEAQSKKRTDTMVAIAEVLSPEQRQEMAKMMMRSGKRGFYGQQGSEQRVGQLEEYGELEAMVLGEE